MKKEKGSILITIPAILIAIMAIGIAVYMNANSKMVSTQSSLNKSNNNYIEKEEMSNDVEDFIKNNVSINNTIDSSTFLDY